MSKDKKTTKGKKTTENTATTSAAIMPITHNLKDYVVTEPVVSKAEEQMRAVIKKTKSKKVVDVVAKSKETTEAAFKELHKEPEKLNAEKVTKAKTTKKVKAEVIEVVKDKVVVKKPKKVTKAKKPVAKKTAKETLPLPPAPPTSRLIIEGVAVIPSVFNSPKFKEPIFEIVDKPIAEQSLVEEPKAIETVIEQPITEQNTVSREHVEISNTTDNKIKEAEYQVEPAQTIVTMPPKPIVIRSTNIVHKDNLQRRQYQEGQFETPLQPEVKQSVWAKIKTWLLTN